MSSSREAFWRSEPDKCCRTCGEHNPKSRLTRCAARQGRRNLHHQSRAEVRAHIMSKLITNRCKIDHLQHGMVHNHSPAHWHQEIAIGVSITAQLARAVEICTCTPKEG
eukprot:138864-Rhodomonas_salina.1